MRAILITCSFIVVNVFAARKNFEIVKKNNTVRITNLKCIVNDPKFVQIPICHIKAINRTTGLIFIRVVLIGGPVNTSNIFLSTYKKANGYRPFVIKATIDACKFFSGKSYPHFDWIYNYIEQYTNINHSCPYNSDMILDKFPINSIILPSLFPDGDYRFDIAVDAYGKVRATVQLFLSIKEPF